MKKEVQPFGLNRINQTDRVQDKRNRCRNNFNLRRENFKNVKEKIS